MKHLVSRPTSTSALLRMLNSILLALLIVFSLTSNKSAYSKTITPSSDEPAGTTELDKVYMAVDSSGDECQSDVDLHTWIQEGEVANGDWQVTIDPATGIGRSVYQTINHDPTYFVSPDNYMNVKIRGSMRVEDTWDNDFIGFVFGYNGPTRSENNDDYDFLLFDWKKETQNQEGRRGNEGRALSKVKGDMRGINNMYDHLWQHEDQAGKFQVKARDWGEDKGWEYDTDYDFELIYTSTRIAITINGERVFDQTGCFKTGRFGFYNFSQQSVRYSDFSYTLATNFEVGGDVCLGQPTDFIFADSCYGIDNTTANLSSWVWDFGDGNTSTEVNPSHIYDNPGTYNVTLRVVDNNGCTDQVTKRVNVRPAMNAISLGDTALCRGEVYSVDIYDPTVSTYRWSDGSTEPYFEARTPGRYWVETSNGFCTYRKEFEVTYDEPLGNLSLGPDKELCVGESLELDATLRGATSYSWILPVSNTPSIYQGNITNPQITVTRAGTYQIVAENACGIKEADINISHIAPPMVSVGDVSSLCYGESINLTASVENANVETQLSWAPGGATTSSIEVSPTQNTTYVVSATNVCGTTTASRQISVVPAIAMQTNATDISCAGEENGKISVAVSGGAGDFTYNWLPNVGSSRTVNELAPGSYTVSVEDAAGCTTEETITISEPAPLAANVSEQVDVNCFGENNGSLTLAAQGGVEGYAYSLNGALFVNDNSFNNLVAGNYAIRVKDNNDCITTVDAQVVQPAAVLETIIDELQDVNCFEANDGQLSLSTQGGTAPYAYSLNNQPFGAAEEFSALAAGSYTIRVRDANNCLTQAEAEITQPELLAASTSLSEEILCYGANSAAAEVSVEGGLAPYIYSWSNGVSTNNRASELGAGTYAVTITDANGCVVENDIVISQPERLVVSLENQTDIFCFGEATGSLNLNSEGGVGTHTYSIDGNNFVATPSFLNLEAGDYTVSVKDGNNCETTIATSLAQPEMALSATMANQKDIDCFGIENGLLLAEAIGGTAPYTFALNGQAFNNSPEFGELQAGSYFIEVKDANNCLTRVEAEITQPELLVASTALTEEILCYGLNTAIAEVSAAGGVAPYVYNWSNAASTTESRMTDLGAGTYEVSIVDANGCEVQNSLVITQPEALSASLESQTNVFCFGETTGAINLRTSGGVGTHLYSINGNSFVNTPSFFNLGAGDYNIIVKDENNCETTLTTSLEQPQMPLAAVMATQKDIDCYGLENGLLLAQAEGGTAPYTYALNGQGFEAASEFDNLRAGNYFIQVKDANNCLTRIDTEISQPEKLETLASVQKEIACFGETNGEATVNVTGGTAPYNYNWSGNQGTTQVITDLIAGTYSVRVVDANGCENESEVTLATPSEIVATIDQVQDIKCFGEANGLAKVNVEGGTAPYEYAWSTAPMQRLPFAAGLAAGSYSVKVTDQHGCTKTLENIVVSQPDEIKLVTKHTDVNCFEGNDGTASVAVSGGTAPFTTVWNGNSALNTERLADLTAGTHNVKVIDNHGCEVEANVVISQPEEFALEIAELSNAYCSLPNGSALVSVIGGNGNVQYKWNGTNISSPLADELEAGAYNVTATDEKGCITALDVMITNTPPPIAKFTHNHFDKDSVQFRHAKFDFRNISVGAVKYAWDFGDGSPLSHAEHPSHAYPDTGTYTVVLTAHDAFNSCPANDSLTLRIFHGGKIFTPNAFSPNGDGVNDAWFVKGEGLSSMELIIFDRWGKELKRITSMEEGWDGRNGKGNFVQEGVYVYLLNAVLNTGAKVKRGGTITLIR